MQRIVTIIMLFALVGCSSDEDRIRSKANTLCENNLIGSPSLDNSPKKDIDLSVLVRKSDLEFLSAGNTDDTNALVASIKPAVSAMIRASAELTTCTVQKVAIFGDSADVTVEEKRPNIGAKAFALLGVLSEIESKSDRDAKAKEQLSEIKVETKIRELVFVKQGDQWVADYQLPEKKKAEDEKKAKMKKADDLMTESTDLSNNYEPGEALKKFNEARRIYDEVRGDGESGPSDEEVKESREALEKRVKANVAGRWFLSEETNAMNDQREVSAYLVSNESIISEYGLGNSFPTLHLRCKANKLEAYVSVSFMVDSDWRRGTKIQYRFDKETAVSERVSRASGGQAFFFRKPGKWIERLLEKSESMFLVEIPVFNKTPQVTKFHLDGIDQVAGKVMAACP